MKAPRIRLVFPVILFVVLTLLLTAAGVIYYLQSDRHIKDAALDKLAAVADLKVTVISAWRKERLQDAAVISSAPINEMRILPFLEKSPDVSGSDPEIKSWMDSIITSKGFLHGVLIDAGGRIRLSTGPDTPVIGAFGRKNIDLVLVSGHPLLSDIQHPDDLEGHIYLNLFAPILRRNPSGQAVCAGMFIFEINPADFLYPLLRKWPEPSRSAESVLVRREGEYVLYLNDFRDRPGMALKSRVPGAMAWRGTTRASEGRDERGVPVLSWISPVPNTPWFLVAKEDLAEIREPLIAQVSSFIVMVFILGFGFGIMLLFWIKRREALYFKNQYEIEHDRLALIQHFEYLHKYANDVVFLTDRNHRLIETNDRAVAVYGYAQEELRNMFTPDLRPPQARESFAGHLAEAEKTGSLIYETLHQRKNGEIFPVEVSLRLLDIGGARYHQAIIRDISERKRAEARIMDALREKEVLLREIHHRVKNNMQVISSLLRLQAAKFPDPEVREAFQESQGRIRSMALVHEKLYGTKDLSRIDFADYLKSLTSSVFASHQVGGRIALQLDLEKTYLDINAAIPCGLIVNELILNAFKHAFPNNREGRILVELRENENEMIRLTVRDDGIGLAEGIEPGRSESLGFQIVSLLASQLEGRIDIRREAGTTISLRFKTPTYADRI
ncbi:MAG: sensor histidine kinase [Candidatus Aminicenantales bacterium]